MEKSYDWTQAARRDSSDIDNLGDVCACAGAGSFSGTVSRSGHRLPARKIWIDDALAARPDAIMGMDQTAPK
jgi:hypothetical protein